MFDSLLELCWITKRTCLVQSTLELTGLVRFPSDRLTVDATDLM